MIDVNSGSFTGRGKGGLEETITKVNTEAAEEVVRQLRLRDIGGIIVIDFIDMARASNRDKVLKTMRKALDADKSKSYVVEVSPLGLVEMTRQNVTDGVREILTAPCPTCDGRGRRALGRDGGARGAAQDARHRRRERRRRGLPDPGQPEGRGRADRSRQRPGRARGRDRQAVPLRGRRRAARSTPSRWSSPAAASEIEERALPFKVGEEVLVKIDEPHMYNADDAVARIDSYIVSVTGGGRFVGERKLVRIEEVERSAAVASLLGAESPNGAGGGAENGSELESAAASRKRSRGRRGGRGRSRAKSRRQGRVSMYAVIETGGKQYKVEKGTSLLVDRLDAKEGDKVALRAVMFRDNEVVAAPKELEKVKVEATVAEHLRGPKIKVFKYKARRATGAAPATAPS